MFISQLLTVEPSSLSSTIAQNEYLIIISRWTMLCTVFIYHNDLSKSHFITLLTNRQYILSVSLVIVIYQCIIVDYLFKILDTLCNQAWFILLIPENEPDVVL